MKKFFFIALAAASMMAVGCNKEVAKSEGPVLPEGEKGFLSFGINLPSANGNTKANGDQTGTDYGDYNDGTADAANVEDIILVLFSGSNESTATLASAYNLSEYRNTFATNPYDQVTVSSSKIIAEVAKSTLTGTNHYAFLILNDHGFYEIEGTDLVATAQGNFKKGISNPDGSMTNIADSKTTLTGKTFAEFEKLLIDEGNRNYGETSFMMTNATYLKDKGQATEAIATLVPVKNNIYNSRAAAETNPAATINVERVLAKVQVTWVSNLKVTNAATEMPIEVTAWDLDNVNTVAFISKNFNAEWKSYGSYNYAPAGSTPVAGKSRMIDTYGIESEDGPSYRTHWALDPNYDKTEAVEYTLFTRANQDDIAIERAKDAIYYCPENTFNVEHMTDNNTTRLVIKTKLNEGKDFYTVTENATVLYQNDNAAGDGSIQKYIYAALGNKKEIRSWMQTYSLTGSVDQYVDLSLTQAYKDSEGNLTNVAAGNTLVPGQHVVTFAAKSSVAESAANAFAPLATENNAYFAKSYKFYYYKSGVAFYQALIKHFGDYETNWEQVDGMVNVTTGANGVYKLASNPEERYLGRYGIVRNNWYNINVTGIRNIGSAVVPDLPGRPDDTVENYIAIQINIMPWVMRPQNVIL